MSGSDFVKNIKTDIFLEKVEPIRQPFWVPEAFSVSNSVWYWLLYTTKHHFSTGRLYLKKLNRFGSVWDPQRNYLTKIMFGIHFYVSRVHGQFIYGVWGLIFRPFGFSCFLNPKSEPNPKSPGLISRRIQISNHHTTQDIQSMDALLTLCKIWDDMIE